MECLGSASELIPKMEQLLTKGEGFWLTVTGTSMSPTLTHLHDKVYITPVRGTPKRGDILLTKTKGNCILHRVIRRDGNYLYYRGDALYTCEGPIPADYVIGKVTKIRHNGKIVIPNRLCNNLCMFQVGIIRLEKRIVVKMKKVPLLRKLKAKIQRRNQKDEKD